MEYKQLLCTIPTSFNMPNTTIINTDTIFIKPEKTPLHVIEPKKHNSEQEFFVCCINNDELNKLNDVKNWDIVRLSDSDVLFCCQDNVAFRFAVKNGYLYFIDKINDTIHSKKAGQLSDITFTNIPFGSVAEENTVWKYLIDYVNSVPSLMSSIKSYSSLWYEYLEFKEYTLGKVENIKYHATIKKIDSENNEITCILTEHIRNLSKYKIEILSSNDSEFEEIKHENTIKATLKEEKRKSCIFALGEDNILTAKENDVICFQIYDVGTHAMLNRLRKNLEILQNCRSSISIRTALWLLDVTSSHQTQNTITIHEFYNKSLNEEQKKAVLQIINTDDVSFILGPPGTGKTSVISEAIYQLTKIDKKIFLSSQSNDAVDNALDRLPKNIDIRPVRLGTRIDEDNPFYTDKLAWNMVEKLTNIIMAQKSKSEKYLEKSQYYYYLFEVFSKAVDKAKVETASQVYQYVLNSIKDKFDFEKDRKWFVKNTVLTPQKAAFELNGVISYGYKNVTEEFSKAYEQYWLHRTTQKEIERQTEIQNIFNQIIEFCKSCDTEEEDIHALLQPDNESFIRELFKSCNVFGITCNSNSANLTQEFFLNSSEIYDYAIIDEVSKATLPEILGCILKSKHVVLIGDHRQLPPVFQADLDDMSEYTPQEIYDFKMLITNTIFKQLYDKANADVKCMLRKQYRMHNEIANTAISQFYLDKNNNTLLENGLTDKESDILKKHSVYVYSSADNKQLVSPEHHIYWVDSTTKNPEKREQHLINSTSTYNTYEIDIIESLLKSIEKTAEPSTTVGVISFYSLQNQKLRERINHMKFNNIKVSVNTVDKFQGQERNIIIVSLVRSVDEKHIPKNNSFFKAFERVNVAFSRAQNLLFIVGSTAFCKKQIVTMPSVSVDSSDSTFLELDLYNRIIEKIKEKNCLFDGKLVVQKEEKNDNRKMQ